MDRLERDIDRLACLGDDLRRRIYLFVRREPHGLRRDEVARELGISSKLAAFHLDKLAAAGVLDFHYARPPGRTGPGAGRPAKVYEPSAVAIDVSIPRRRYDLVGTLLLDAIAGESGESHTGSVRERAGAIAFDAGLDLGRAVRTERRLRAPGVERALSVASEVLDEQGFEPVRDGDAVHLRNCPFQALARHAPDLVCAMNHSFVTGLLQGLGNRTVEVGLQPAEGRCCVRLCRAAGSTKGR